MTPLPMFPLESMLFPGMPLRLHVFEPRYRTLMAACIGGAERGEPPEFGVVLIEQKTEIKNDDQRFTIGTVARLTEMAPLADGHYLSVAIKTRQITIRT